MEIDEEGITWTYFSGHFTSRQGEDLLFRSLRFKTRGGLAFQVIALQHKGRHRSITGITSTFVGNCHGGVKMIGFIVKK